jgi:hypothetical protein
MRLVPLALIALEPLGFPGFDIGVALTAAKINNEAILERATSEDVPDILPIPTLRAHLGLPLGFEIGAMYAAVVFSPRMAASAASG